jgi:hypothetical protein
MHQQGPPTQQPQASSSTPVYQQQLQTAQQASPSHTGASPSPFATGSNPTTVPDVLHSMTPSTESMVTQTSFKNTANNRPIHQLDPPYTFGATAGQHSDVMDFTFDSIAIDDFLEPMEAIENPLWMQTMMLPGCASPFVFSLFSSLSVFVHSAASRGQLTRIRR